MARLARLVGLSAIALGVAACGADDQREASATSDEFDGEEVAVNLRGLVGIDKNPPDEFAVSTVKPLELPENFAALPPPTPGVRSRLAPDPIADARKVLLGEVAPQAANARVSASESALLTSAGAGNASPEIRNVLQAEQDALDESRPTYVIDQIFPSIRRRTEQADALTASEERVRLSETLPPREIGSTATATIPSIPGSTAAAPAVTPPAVVPPTTELATGDELIFIPE